MQNAFLKEKKSKQAINFAGKFSANARTNGGNKDNSNKHINVFEYRKLLFGHLVFIGADC